MGIMAKCRYIHSITLDNASNDPTTVVKNFGTHFTWDNEREKAQKTISMTGAITMASSSRVLSTCMR